MDFNVWFGQNGDMVIAKLLDDSQTPECTHADRGEMP